MAKLYHPIITSAQLKSDISLRWRRFSLDYECWNLPQKKLPTHLPKWQEVKFDKPNRSFIPNEQGVYAFVLKNTYEAKLNMQHRFILYIGQAKNLNERFNSYFYYENNHKPTDQLKRLMTIVWENLLFFNYFTTPGFTSQELTDIEYDLIDFLVPPMNDRWRAQYVNSITKLSK